MVPRTEVVAISQDAPMEKVIEIAGRHQHSRYPVFERTLDNVVGILPAKRLLALASREDRDILRLRDYLSPPLFVPGTLRASSLLPEMRRARAHIAIVVDEYGMTDGIVTLTDVVSRIAGEVLDEAERGQPAFQPQADGSTMVDGLALLEDVEHVLGVQIQDAEVDTLGGHIFGRLGRRPQIGDAINISDYRFEVAELDALRIARVRVSKLEAVEQHADQHAVG
jgi:CBS domain containing-hemolysin-like protein